MPKRLTFRERLDRFPPILIRLLVVRGRKKSDRYSGYAPTDAQLAKSCGLTMAELKFVSYSTAWDGPVMGYLDRYLRGCAIDLESRRCFLRLQWMRVHGTFEHLRKSEDWPMFREMLELFEESQNT